MKYIFTAFSSSSQATAPIAEASGVLYMSATVSKIGTGKYVFRDFWDMEDAGRSIGRAINKEGIKNLGILALNYGDTESFLKGLKSTLNNKIQIKEERYDFGETDFKTQLSKLKSFEADGIIVYGFPGAESTKITQQIKELGLDNARLFGSSNYGYTYMHLPLRDTLSKMRLIDVWYSLDPGNIQSQKFITKYNRTYWQDLVGDAAYTYDDLHALAIAMKKRGADADTADIAEALRETNLDGAAGKLTFDTLGNSKRESYLHIYEENGWNKYNTLT